jgi:flagellar biogenesis protein FliO
MDVLKDVILPLFGVVLIVFAAYAATKWIAKKQNTYVSGRIIKIIERVMISKDVYLAVVQVDTKVYFMSVSAGKTELLSELPLEMAEKLKAAQQSGDFMGILMNLLGSRHDKNNPKGQD